MDKAVLNTPVVESPGSPSDEKPQDEMENFEAQSDEALRELIAQAGDILRHRESERRKNALAEIQRLAKDNGLNVSVKKPARKRGRPRKANPAAS